MKPTPWTSFTFVAALSMLLCAGLAAWWIFGDPPRPIAGYFQWSSLAPPTPFYDDPELFGVPLYWLLVLTGILPLAWIGRTIGAHFQHRRQRAKAGFCHSCGYDLRATPNQCPECGAIPLKIGNS